MDQIRKDILKEIETIFEFNDKWYTIGTPPWEKAKLKEVKKISKTDIEEVYSYWRTGLINLDITCTILYRANVRGLLFYEARSIRTTSNLNSVDICGYIFKTDY